MSDAGVNVEREEVEEAR